MLYKSYHILIPLSIQLPYFTTKAYAVALDIKRAEPSGPALIRRLASLSSVSDHHRSCSCHEHQCAHCSCGVRGSRIALIRIRASCRYLHQAVDCRIDFVKRVVYFFLACQLIRQHALGIVHGCFYRCTAFCRIQAQIQLVRGIDCFLQRFLVRVCSGIQSCLSTLR